VRPPIVADQADFERWLVEETSVLAFMVQRIKNGESAQTGIGADMTQWRFTCLAEVLARYADRDPAHLISVAHDRKALLEVIRNGESLLARCEREAAVNYTCRGCDGTCCTGVGSDPCTCPPPAGSDND
jgi:hypothetical protein